MATAHPNYITIPIPCCIVCLFEYNHITNKPLVVMPCCHTFCSSCLPKLTKCPLCNHRLSEREIKPNWALLEILPKNPNNQNFDAETNWNRWFKKGQDLFTEKKYQEAIESFEMAQSLKPTFELHYLKGRCFIELKKYNETIYECEKAISITSNKPKPYFLKGFALYKLKNFDNAIKEFNMVNIMSPNEIMSYYWKACCLHQLKMYLDAIEYYDKALRLNPNHQPSINNKKVTLSLIEKSKTETGRKRSRISVPSQLMIKNTRSIFQEINNRNNS